MKKIFYIILLLLNISIICDAQSINTPEAEYVFNQSSNLTAGTNSNYKFSNEHDLISQASKRFDHNYKGGHILLCDINAISNRMLFNKNIPGLLVPEQNLKNGNEESTKNKSFFKSNWFYFIGAVAIAAAVYVLWPAKEKPTITNSTFGIPSLPH